MVFEDSLKAHTELYGKLYKDGDLKNSKFCYLYFLLESM